MCKFYKFYICAVVGVIIEYISADWKKLAKVFKFIVEEVSNKVCDKSVV